MTAFLIKPYSTLREQPIPLKNHTHGRNPEVPPQLTLLYFDLYHQVSEISHFTRPIKKKNSPKDTVIGQGLGFTK